MKKKLGPLQLWQWLAIGVALGFGTYLYRRTHPATAPSSTPSDAVFNPIDPTTGLPFAGGLTTGAATSQTGAPTAAPMTLSDLLEGFQSVEDLFAGLQSLGVTPGPATNTSTSTTSTQTGAKPAKTKKKKEPSTAQLLTELKKPHSASHERHVRSLLAQRGVKAPKPPKHGGTKNPGHTVQHHPGGRRTPSSSAPHNSRQHQNVAPPSHQRHNPTRHPSARGPGIKRR